MDFADVGIHLPPGATGEVKIICPKCGGAKRSKRENRNDKDLSVNVSEGVWNCWHCNWTGTIKTTGNGYGSSLKSYERPKPIVQAPETARDRLYRWFETERGISRATVDRNRVTVHINESGMEAIAFPYFRGDEHIHTTYRAYDKKFWQSANTERIFYGLDEITPDTTEVIICEGQIDKLAFNEAGIWNVLSVPDGAPDPKATNTGTKFAYLASATELFKQFTRVYLAGDNDPNGQALNRELGRRIGRERCRVIQWPEYCKDANDALKKVGPALIHEHVERAVPFPVEGIVYGPDLHDDLDDLYDNGYDRGLKIGMRNHDEHYRVRAGLMTILTGVASHGKSLWLDHIMVRLAKKHDWRFAIFSPENQPLKRHYANLLEIYVGKPFDQGFTTRMERDEYLFSRRFIDDHFAWILPEDPSIDAILERAQILLFQTGINGLVIDPWNEIEHACPSGKNMTDYISEVLGKIRAFARRNDIHVWVMAHPTKGANGFGDLMPTMNEIAGSVHFRNKADFGVVIWRNPKDPSVPSKCSIEKVRFSETGKVGEFEFRYDAATRQIKEV